MQAWDPSPEPAQRALHRSDRYPLRPILGEQGHCLAEVLFFIHQAIHFALPISRHFFHSGEYGIQGPIVVPTE